VAAGFYEREININIESAVEEVGRDVDGDRCDDLGGFAVAGGIDLGLVQAGQLAEDRVGREAVGANVGFGGEDGDLLADLA